MIARHPRGGPPAGFTIVELLVLIAIIGLLVALLLPAVQSARESARRAVCANNIREVASALGQYHSAHGSLPIPTANRDVHESCENIYSPYSANLLNKAGATPGSVYTFIVAVLPYLGRQSIYDRMNLTQGYGTVTNKPLVETVIPTLICPSDPDAASPILPWRAKIYPSSPDVSVHGLWYAGSAGPTATNGGFSYCPSSSDSWCRVSSNAGPCDKAPSTTIYYLLDGRNWYGLFGRRWIATSFDQVLDGLSNTVMLAETLPKNFIYNGAYNAATEPLVSLAAPINAVPIAPGASPFLGTYSSNHFQIQVQSPRSMHPRGCHMAMADGAVAFLSDLTALEVICRLGNRKDGGIAAVP